MSLRTFFAAVLFTVLMVSSAEARYFQPPTLDQLAQAPLICNGRVVSLTNTLEKGDLQWPFSSGGEGVPIEYWIAKIHVLSTTKGTLPADIELRYPGIDEHPAKGATVAIMDGPIQMQLETGKRYRFYLKAAPGRPYYVSVLDGKFDDAFAAQHLADIEPDDSPLPISPDVAIKRAVDYVAKFKPGAINAPNSPSASQWEGNWTVSFWWTPAVAHNSEPDAFIRIDGNSLIDPDTWITDGTRPKPQDLGSADIGRDIWVGLKPNLKDSFSNSLGFGRHLLRGRLESIGTGSLTLSRVSQWQEPETWATLTVPVADVAEVRRLIPGATPPPIPAR